MNKSLKPSLLPMITLVGGILTMLLRLWLLALGEDDRGLLPAGIFPDVASWILTGLMMAALLIGTWNLNEAAKYSFNFPASERAAYGVALGAIGILITSIMELLSGPDTLTVFSCILGLLTVPALLFVARCRKKGLRPSILFHGIVCVYLMIHLLSHYRLWNGFPQLQRYGFDLLAIVFLMLAGYQRAAFDVGHGNRRSYALFSLAALFFCIAALPGSENPAFYFGSAAWMLMTPCNMKPLPAQFPKHEA